MPLSHIVIKAGGASPCSSHGTKKESKSMPWAWTEGASWV